MVYININQPQKTAILAPLKQRISTKFNDLPLKLLIEVLLHVPLRELLECRLLNKRFKTLISSQLIWRYKLMQDFPEVDLKADRLNKIQLRHFYGLAKRAIWYGYGKDIMGSLGGIRRSDNEEEGVKLNLGNVTKITCGTRFSLILCKTITNVEYDLYTWGTINPQLHINATSGPLFINTLLRVNPVDIAAGCEHALILTKSKQLYLLKCLTHPLVKLSLGDDDDFSDLEKMVCGEAGNVLLFNGQRTGLIRFDYEFSKAEFIYDNLILPRLYYNESIKKMGCNKYYTFIITTQGRCFLYCNTERRNKVKIRGSLKLNIKLICDKSIMPIDITKKLKVKVIDLGFSDSTIYILTNMNIIIWFQLNLKSPSLNLQRQSSTTHLPKVIGSMPVGLPPFQPIQFWQFKGKTLIFTDNMELVSIPPLEDKHIYSQELQRRLSSKLKINRLSGLKDWYYLFPTIKNELKANHIVLDCIVGGKNWFVKLVDLDDIPKKF